MKKGKPYRKGQNRSERDRKSNYRHEATKDSRDKRVNYDNARESKVMKDISCTNQSNDVRWYANNPELLRSAASLPFSTTTGIDLPYEGDLSHAPGATRSVPGILSVLWEPSIGGDFTDPINRAKDATYSFTVHANSRNKTYDAADEMLIILAGASLFSMIAIGVRAYGVMRTFDQQNKYWPRGFIEAMGFTYDDLRDNYSRMWFDLNEIIARSRQIWIPNVFPFIERWFWMGTNIYMDSESVKGQYYMYVPHGYWTYTEDLMGSGIGGLSHDTWYNPPITSDGSAGTNTVYIGTTGTEVKSGIGYQGKTWKEYMDILNTMMNSLLNSQDRGIIFGDILKAYGEGSIYALQPVSVDYVTPYVYDREVLTQIENSNAFSSYAWGVAQNPATGNLYTVGDAFSSTTVDTKPLNVPNPNWKILNFHQKETPSPEQIMVATRMMCLGKAGIGKDDSILTFNTMVPGTTGTEYVYSYGITSFLSKDVTMTVKNMQFNGTTWAEKSTATIKYPKGGPGTFETTFVQSSITTGATNSPLDNINDQFSNVQYLWTSFDWAPWGSFLLQDQKITAATKKSEVQPSKVVYYVGDYDYYTTIDIEVLKKMHATAIYSEFNVPNM